MKVTSNTTHKFDFPSKDGKRLHTMKVEAKSEAEARSLLTGDLEHALDQLEEADKKEAAKNPPAPQGTAG